MKNLQFPLIAFKNKKLVNFYRDMNELTSCSKYIYNNKYFNGLTLIEQTGNVYTINHAEKTASITPFWEIFLFKAQKYRVRLIFDNQVENVNIADFKELILRAINSDQDFWDSGGDLNEIIKNINDAHSIKEIIEPMTEQFFKEY